MKERDFIEEQYIRVCNVCGKEMWEGYCLGSGEEYYCSDECLFSVYGEQEWSEIYEEDGGYWTEWYDEQEQLYDTYIAVKEDKIFMLSNYGFKESPYGDIYIHYLGRVDPYAEGFSIIVNPNVKDKNYPKNTLTVNYYFEDRVDSIRYDDYDSDWVVIDADNTRVIDIIARLWNDGLLEEVKVRK